MKKKKRSWRRPQRRKKRIRKPVLIVLILLAAGLFFLRLRLALRKEAVMRQEEELVLHAPQAHDYDWAALQWNDYDPFYEDERYFSRRGIDVSSHQKQIDWAAVKASGIEFAFIRVGYRGYETGILMADEMFETNIQGAIANGIDVGIYFFSQASSTEEAREEADFVINKIRPYRIDLPVVFDMERISGESGRIEDLPVEARTQIAVTFLNHVQNEGYVSMIYNSSDVYEELFDLDYLYMYKFWVAHYAASPSFPYQFAFWQYTDQGNVAGISTAVDMDLQFILKNAE